MKKKLMIMTVVVICCIAINFNYSLATEELLDVPEETSTILTEPVSDIICTTVETETTVISTPVEPVDDVVSTSVETPTEPTITPTELIDDLESTSIKTPSVDTVSTLEEEPMDIVVEESARLGEILLTSLADTIEESTDEMIRITSSEEPTVGARSATNSNGDVFLGGNYLEVGISSGGSFGTSTSAPVDFNSHATSSNGYQLGLLMDGDGWDVGNPPTTGDFFLPGTPEERYGIAYKIGGTTYQYFKADRNYGSSSNFIVTTEDASDIENGLLKAIVRGTTPENVVVENTYSFGVDDKFYKTDVRVINNSEYEITDVRFFRSFDPDQDVEIYDEYTTYNKVICNPDSSLEGGEQNFAMVVARGYYSLEGFFLVSFDNRARASHGVAFSPKSLYLDGLWVEKKEGLPTYSTEESLQMSKSNINGYTAEDNAIAMTFNIGTLASGEGTELSHFSSLDPDVISSLNKIISVISATVESRTDESITINTTDGYEYSIDGGETWQTSDTFEGLEPNTEYTIISRIIGTEETSEFVTSTKESSPETPSISERIITENSITLQNIEGYEYSIDGGETWQDSPEFTGLNENTEYEFVARLKETENAMPGRLTEPIVVKTLEKPEINLDNVENVDVIVELNSQLEKLSVNKALIYLAICDDEDIVSAIENKQKVDIKFIVNDSKASAKELELINEKLRNGEEIAFVVDISIELYVDNECVKTIKELNKPITFTVTIPNKYLEKGKNFRILRTHENDSEGFEILELADEDGEDATITISSDKFSNYTIVYEKIVAVANVETESKPVVTTTAGTTANENHSEPEEIINSISSVLISPKTGDNIALCELLLVLCIINLLIMTIIEHKRAVV